MLLNYANYVSGISPFFEMIGRFIRDSFINIDGTGQNYSNPFIIIESVAYFLFFTTLVFKSKIINKLAGLVIGVYLIHENTYLRGFLYKWIGIDNGPIYSSTFIIRIFLAAIGIYIGCLIIEFIRQIIFKYIYNSKIATKIRKKYYSFIKSIKFS